MANGCNPKTSNQMCLSYDDIKQKVEALKILDKVIVFLMGTWDLLHVGHCRYFRSAIEAVIKKTGKAREDIVLIVGVDNDQEVKNRKGKFRPIVPQQERLEMLTHIKYVDYVILKIEEEQSWDIVDLLKPNFLVISESTKFINEEKELMIKKLEQWADEVIILPPQAETSTTGKIRTLLTGTVVPIREKFENFVHDFNSLLDKMVGGG